MNPYQQHLGDLDPIEVIAATADRLQAAAERLGQKRVNLSPAPGKWSPREILCHLADTEITFAFRLRQAMAEPYHVVQPYDQDLWAKRYNAYDASTAIGVFRAVRDWNRTFISGVSQEEFGKKLTHPERGEMTFRVLVETIAGHDLNHLKQLDSIV